MQLFYEYDYVTSMTGGKYYYYYFMVVNEKGKEADHQLNDEGTLTWPQVRRSRDKALKQCKKLKIEPVNALECS